MPQCRLEYTPEGSNVYEKVDGVDTVVWSFCSDTVRMLLMELDEQIWPMMITPICERLDVIEKRLAAIESNKAPKDPYRVPEKERPVVWRGYLFYSVGHALFWERFSSLVCEKMMAIQREILEAHSAAEAKRIADENIFWSQPNWDRKQDYAYKKILASQNDS